MIGDFHFLRPDWLWALVAAGALLWLVSRREDIRNRWRGVIASELLEHLIVESRQRLRVRPVHLTVGAIILGSVALAGPTWERERPPFVEDKAPLVIAIDLSQTMDAIDVTPSRLERAKLKVHDLLALRPGARTALFAYAGSAHLVLPLTDDATLLKTYVDSLATRIMPKRGKNTAGALQVIETALAREETPGTILFLTDGVEAEAFGAFKAHKGKNELMVLGIGTEEGGPVKTGPDSFLLNAGGGRVYSKLDVDGLSELKNSAGIPVATMTLDDSDIQWVQRRVQSHLQQKQADEQLRWKDMGWWLAIPIGLLGAIWFRRGWTIRWASSVLLALTLSHPQGADAADRRLLDPWLTADQQGRLYFERGDYATAAERFTDPMWKGVALYRAARYSEAVDAFARADSAASDFNQGNALAQLGKFPEAAASYQQALKRRPDWQQAKDNLALVQRLIPKKEKGDEQAVDPNQPPDQIQFDEKGKKGKSGTMTLGQQTAEMWMRNIQTTPTQLLARKFALEDVEQRK